MLAALDVAQESLIRIFLIQKMLKQLMRYIYNPVTQELDDTTDKNFGKKNMKIKEYNQMMNYLTRREPTIKESKGAFKQAVRDYNKEPAKLVDSPILKNNINAVPKRDISDHIDQQRHIYEGTPLSEKNKKINVALAKGGTPKKEKKLSYKEQYNQYFGGGIPKNKTPLATEKNNIVIAMSETPAEEFQLDLSAEMEQFKEWLKKNKNGTYKEFLKDKTAMLTEEQKKDPKIIDLEPYLPSFEDIIKEYELEQEQKKETLEQFINRRSEEIRLTEADRVGVSSLLRRKL